MNANGRIARTAVLLVFLAWFAAVLLRYDRLDSAEAFVALLLVTGWVAIFSLACLGAGRAALMACGGQLQRWEDWLITAGLGCAVLVAAGLLLSLPGWFRPLPLAAVLAAGAGMGAQAAWGWRRKLSWPPCYRRLLPLGALIAAVAVATLLVTASASPFYDQFHYHLGFPYQWLRSGNIEVFPRHAYSFFPAAMGILFAYPLGWLGTWAAQAVHWWTGALAVLATAALAGRLGGPRAALVAAAVLAATPSVIQVSTWAAADLGAAAFGALAWLLLLRSRRQVAESPGAWLAVGVLAGLAAAAKVLALTTVVAPVFIVAAATVARHPRLMISRLLWMSAGVLVAFGPWAARSLVLTGDPVYPFGTAYLGRLMGGAGGDQSLLARGIVGGEAAVKSPTLLVTLGTFRPAGNAGAIGPAFLAVLPLAAWSAYRDRRRGAAVLAAGMALAWAGWAVGPPRGRYLLPVLPLLAALGATGWGQLVSVASRRVRPTLAALLLFALGWSAVGGATPVEMRRLAITLGVDSGEELMRQYVTYWPAIRFVNSELPRDAKLLLVGEARPYLLDRELIVEDPFQRPLLVELAEAGLTPEGIAAALRAQGVTHLLVNDQEGRRIAAMNGRGSFLQPNDAAAGERLEAFLRACLRPLFVDRHVAVYALAGCGR